MHSCGIYPSLVSFDWWNSDWRQAEVSFSPLNSWLLDDSERSEVANFARRNTTHLTLATR